jgi:hypothetical protein
LLCFIYIFTDLCHGITKVTVMTRFLLCFVLYALLSFHVTAQKEDRVLQQKLQSLVSGFRGDVGGYGLKIRFG